MARLRVVVGHDPDLLIRTAANGFLEHRAAIAESPFPTVPYLLALRQGGLRDDVLAMAASNRVKGWFDPPLCIFHELPVWLGAPERKCLSEIERLVLLARIAREHGAETFGEAGRAAEFVRPIDSLFGELIPEGVSAQSFADAIGGRTDRDAFEVRRDASLASMYAAYLAELARLGCADGRDGWLHCATSIRSGSAKLHESLRGRREIRLFGLMDLRRGWLHLIRALVESDAIDLVSIYTSVELPLEELVFDRETLARAKPSMASALFSARAGDARIGHAGLVVAPDIDREMDQMALDIRALVDAGTAPGRIAVVARDARPNLDRAITALAQLGVPVTARRRYDLAAIPVVRAINALFAAAADGWTRRGLVEIARQPYIGSGLDAEVLNVAGFRRLTTGLASWSDALEQLESDARRRESDESGEGHGRALPAADRVAAARAALDGFTQHARALDEPRTLAGWIQWMSDFLERDPWLVLAAVDRVPDDRFDIVRVDLAGWKAMVTIVGDWQHSVELHDPAAGTISAGGFARMLREMLSGDVPLWTPMQRGVQVLESLAAAYRSFEHVFLIGMQSSAFPRAAPRSTLLGEQDRAALALARMPFEPRELWDSRERELFRVLAASATAMLNVSYARLDAAGREVLPSAFVEELELVATVTRREIAASQVVLTGIPLYSTADGPELALHGATIERERIARVASMWNGRITSPDILGWLSHDFGDDHMWSATQLEELAKCPWAYFSKRVLRIEKLQEPSDDIEPTIAGALLHDVLKRFYDRALERGGGPVFLMGADREWAFALAIRSVDEIVGEYSARNRLGHPALLVARRAEYRRIVLGLLEFEIALHEAMFEHNNKKKAPKMIRTGVQAHEVAFENMMFERDGVRIRYRGSIDRVEISIDERTHGASYLVVADYKTSKSAVPGGGEPSAWTDGVALQLPLYAYALDKLRHPAMIARTSYLTLKRPEQVLPLDLYTINFKTGEAESGAPSETKWTRALDAAIAHVKRARRGEFPAGPPGKCTCPPWCHGRDICRVAGGPVGSR